MALDSVLAPTTRPVFIKLDVEGAECAVVRGMRNFLRDSAQIIGFAMEVSQSRAMSQARRHRLRPAGSPEAPLSVRSSLRLRRASVVQPRPISHMGRGTPRSHRLLLRPHRTTTTQATLCYYYCPGHTVRMEGRTMATQKPHAMERPIRRSARLLKPMTSARSNLEAGDSKRSA